MTGRGGESRGRGGGGGGGGGGRGGSRGRGRGTGRGGATDKEVVALKKNLQKSIQSAEAALKKLEVTENKKKNKPHGGEKMNHTTHQQPRPVFAQHSHQPHPSPFQGGHSFAPQEIPPYGGISDTRPFNVQGNRPQVQHPLYYPDRPPPPSYEESVGVLESRAIPTLESIKVEKPNTDQAPDTKRPAQKDLKVDALVKTLAIFRGHYEKAETIGRHVDKHPDEVMRCARSRKDLFAVMGKGKDAMIELVPKVSLCADYFTENGCNTKDTCEKLHICKTYVTEYCNSGSNCEYGHRWDTNHNSKILSKFYLDLIQRNTLHQVMKKLFKVNSKLKVCANYNNDQGCKYDPCRWLHICKPYVLGSGKCTVKGCSLNHNIIDKQCSSLLKASGVSLNESPRDILLLLLSSMDASVGKDSNEKDMPKKKTKDEKAASGPDSLPDDDSDTDHSENSEDETIEGEPSKSKKKTKQRKKSKTVKSTDLMGEVVIPEICVFSVDNKCINEKKGCKYLHSKSLFHWQVEKDNKWYNFRIFQSKKLESAYRDVNQASTEVPALEKSKVEDHAKELLNVLGNNSWKADFQTMTITKSDSTLKIRRLSTQSAALFQHPKATVFEWYCQDDQGKWIPFGKANLFGNISSEEVEKLYLSDPSSSMLICIAESKFKLEFSRMVQVNLATRGEKEIRRRPAGLMYQRKPADADDQSSLPSHWSPMAANQTHLLVTLDADSNEYQEVATRIRLTLPTAFIVSVKRLQNPYLWRLLQFKKEELSRRYDENQLNMQKLFHGVNPSDTEVICTENFDWRRSDTSNQEFGQGTYFFNSAAVGRTHCKPDEFGRIHMFLAQVVIGMVTEGDPSYTRPPPNPNTGFLYDTTVDNIIAPTVFVKYEKGEYYPEYIIEFY
ncbi:protein mono-ADP-ribosyltransferase PARP12-like isoform X2 [Macrobrachium nipponense]|uniref:protein mono-ADP-ribosyltransferase PARP12-like isoform X2 n=1 Tax=Macrobrachium nipponense TaxID=159736 RepID=UPI0030C818A7